MSIVSNLIAEFISYTISKMINYEAIIKEIEKVNLQFSSDLLTNEELHLAQQFKELSDLCLTNKQDSIKDLEKYIDLCQNFKLTSISDVTANKCIIDPLGNPISDITNIRIDVSEVNDWMIKELSKNPTDLYQLSSRRFEELIAEILMRKGYKIELTPATRDGGKDIYAAHKDDLGSFLYLVECKKYDPTHKVGVKVIRDLYGVLSKEKATYGIVVTTSDFTKPAQEFQEDIKFQMSLKNFDSIQKWLCDVI